jgi:hypothetical protein
MNSAYEQVIRVTRRDALLVLLWLHVPCYVTVILFSAQHDGYPISNRAALEAVLRVQR